MQPRSTPASLIAVSIVALGGALGVQTPFEQVKVSIGGNGNLVRRQRRDVIYGSLSEPPGLEWVQALRRTDVWPMQAQLPSKTPVVGMTKQANIRHVRTDSDRENTPDGVVCPTWLHRDIQHENLKPFVHSMGVKADGFVAVLSRLCGAHRSTTANYSGSWENQVPLENDVRVLHGLTQWAKIEKRAGRSKSLTWDQFSKPDKGHSMANFTKFIMSHPTNISASGSYRILDFGCGGGTDIVAIQRALNTTVEDTLCLDVYPSRRSDVRQYLLNPASSSSYRDSLAKALVGNENTVHLAISMVTFHHIPDPKMRLDALGFLQKVLHPGGIFIMAEWDNSLLPDRWIHYDLVHLLPGMLFSGDAPNKRTELKIGTKYLSVKDWQAVAKKSGLRLDEARSKVYGLTPEAQAAWPHNPNRDFHMVFGKGGP